MMYVHLHIFLSILCCPQQAYFQMQGLEVNLYPHLHIKCSKQLQYSRLQGTYSTYLHHEQQNSKPKLEILTPSRINITLHAVHFAAPHIAVSQMETVRPSTVVLLLLGAQVSSSAKQWLKLLRALSPYFCRLKHVRQKLWRKPSPQQLSCLCRARYS